MDYYNLNYWQTGEYQVIEEHLEDLAKKKIQVCPKNKDIFRSLKETPYETVKVCIVGQDPYPNPAHATGLAFSIPDSIPRRSWPPTLINILREYQDDLHYPEPTSGNLSGWARQGVLLWNSIPTCTAFHSMSHAHWPEWSYLNKELLGKLCEKGEVVFVFLGGVAKDNMKYLVGEQIVLTYSHPSPRGSLNSRTPFLGSRMFTTINSHLKETINWRL